jgi:hypothetical protein
MEAAENPLRGLGVIVLNKRQIDACGFVTLLLPGFDKIPTFIAENLRLDEQHTFDRCLYDFHYLSPSIKFSRY